MDIRYCWLLVVFLALTTGATCNNQSSESGQSTASSAPRVTLPGVDTSTLTTREHQGWSDLVRELLSPCKDVAVPLAACVSEKRACSLCLPAAKFLLRQVQAGRPKKEIVQVYGDRFAPDKIKSVVIGASPSKGPPDAPVTVVEFADFECPACGAAYPLVEKAFAKFEGKVRLVFKHFPLSAHPNAKLAAQAAYAAQKQGQFWRMHKVLFENQLQLTEPELVGYAQQVGLDVAKFKVDMHSQEAKQRVAQEKEQGEALGVDATPTIYINGRTCDLSLLANPLTELEEWIQLELDQSRQAPNAAATASASASSTASAAASSTASASAAPTASASAVPIPPASAAPTVAPAASGSARSP